MKKKKNQTQKKQNKFTDKVAKAIKNDSLGDKFLYDRYCIENKIADSKSYKITLEALEKIYNQSLNIDKKPLLIIGIRRNDKEIFMLHCVITTEQDRKGR